MSVAVKRSDLSPEELYVVRRRDREEKQKSRDRKKEALRQEQPVPVWEAMEEFTVSHAYDVEFVLEPGVSEFMAKVEAELGRPLDDSNEDYAIDFVFRCLHGLKQTAKQDVRPGWVRKVRIADFDGTGDLVSGKYFPDSPSEVIEYANRLGLRKSPTFNAAYLELMALINKRYGHAIPVSMDIQVVQAELNGTYRLPVPKTPKVPQPKPEPKLAVPSTAAILEQGLIKMERQLPPTIYDPNMPLAARNYLDGI